MEIQKKIVYFESYCPKCQYEKVKETDDPCNRCLNYPVNNYSHRPVEFKEKENG